MGFGIIRFKPTGWSPENDPCHFDGWYARRDDAQEIMDRWVKAHAGWHVALIDCVSEIWTKDAPQKRKIERASPVQKPPRPKPLFEAGAVLLVPKPEHYDILSTSPRRVHLYDAQSKGSLCKMAGALEVYDRTSSPPPDYMPHCKACANKVARWRLRAEREEKRRKQMLANSMGDSQGETIV